MARTRNPDLGQLALDIPMPPADVRRDVPNSFSKAVTPAFQGLSIEMYADLTPDQINYVTPDFLQNSLLGVSKEADNAVFYRNPETKGVTFVAVPPAEFKLLAGNITTLGNRARSHVLSSRAAGVPKDVDVEAAARGAVHAVQPKLEKLERYRRNVLGPQIGEVNWLLHASNSPGYAWKDGYNIGLLITNFRTFVLNDMLVAMAQAGNWSEEKSKGVQQVLEYKLFFERDNNQHIENWKQLLGVAQTYLGYKRALFDEKIAKARQYTSKHAE